jgi:aconitate hydratase
MGVLPCQFLEGESARTLGLTGMETYDITGLAGGESREANVVATAADGKRTAFKVRILLLTPKEREFFRHGGILQYVLRQLAAKSKAA